MMLDACKIFACKKNKCHELYRIIYVMNIFPPIFICDEMNSSMDTL